MPQEDRLKREIDQTGKVLAAILSKLLGLKSTDEPDAAIAYTNEALKNTLKLDIAALCRIEPEEFMDTLTNELNLTDQALDTVGNILYQTALLSEGSDAPEPSRALLLRSQLIFGYLISVSTNYSLDWYYKQQDIQNRL